MLISILAGIFLVILGSTLHKFGNSGFWIEKKIANPLKRLFMFNLFIKAQQFGYVYFVLSGINKKVFQNNIVDLGSTISVVNSVLYYMTFAYVTLYPIIVCCFLIVTGPVGLQNSKVVNYFGAIYSGLDVNSRLNVHSATLFLVRRLIIGVSIAFLRDYYFLQLEILLVICLIVLCFTIIMQPYNTKI